ncbi:MAG: TatD family hydrolase [Nannocystaceae bacterium]
MKFFDTHSHLDFPIFASSAERRFAVNRAKDAGIRGILLPAFSPISWTRTLQTSSELRDITQNVCIHTALGIHPWAIADLPQSEIDHALNLLRSKIAAGIAPVAFGECGLDFGRRGSRVPRATQVRVFEQHLKLCRMTGIPLVIHCVAAFGPLLELLAASPTPPCILHSFSGSPEVATLLCRSGHYISFASAVTLPEAKRPKAAATAVPLGQLLIETDSPDQLPFTRRTDAQPPPRSEPAFVVDIAQAIATLRGVSLAEIAGPTWDNACRVLSLGPDGLHIGA